MASKSNSRKRADASAPRDGPGKPNKRRKLAEEEEQSLATRDSAENAQKQAPVEATQAGERAENTASDRPAGPGKREKAARVHRDAAGGDRDREGDEEDLVVDDNEEEEEENAAATSETWSTKTTKEKFAERMKAVKTFSSQQCALLMKTCSLNKDEEFVVDVSKYSHELPDGMFALFDSKTIHVDTQLLIRSGKHVATTLNSIMKDFQPQLRNKNSLVGKSKGQNCRCHANEAITSLLSSVKDTFVMGGEKVVEHLELFARGYCRRITATQFMNTYMKANNLYTQDRQFYKMDGPLKAAFAGSIPAGKLYIKLPVEDKVKSYRPHLIAHENMRLLVTRFGSPHPTKKRWYNINFGKLMKTKVISRVEFLDALPFITQKCRETLMANFSECKDKTRLKIPMDTAVRKGYLDRALNTAEVLTLTLYDFTPSSYRIFFSNVLLTHNLDTEMDFKKFYEDADPRKSEMYSEANEASYMQDQEYTMGIWNSLSTKKQHHQTGASRQSPAEAPQGQ